MRSSSTLLEEVNGQIRKRLRHIDEDETIWTSIENAVKVVDYDRKNLSPKIKSGLM